MNALPKGSIVVLTISGQRSTLAVAEASEALMRTITSLNYIREGEFLVRQIQSEDERLALIRSLMAAKALFSGGPDWSPYEVVAYLHEQGKVSGPYSEIVWKNPTAYVVRQHGLLEPTL